MDCLECELSVASIFIIEVRLQPHHLFRVCRGVVPRTPATYELQSKLLVSLLITPIVVPYIIPFKEFGLQLILVLGLGSPKPGP